METGTSTEDQIKILRAALETRMGKRDADDFYARAVHESKNELGFDGRTINETELLARILWRIQRKNEILVEIERRDHPPKI